MRIFHWVTEGVEKRDWYLREDGFFLGNTKLTAEEIGGDEVVDVPAAEVDTHLGIVEAHRLRREALEANIAARLRARAALLGR